MIVEREGGGGGELSTFKDGFGSIGLGAPFLFLIQKVFLISGGRSGLPSLCRVENWRTESDFASKGRSSSSPFLSFPPNFSPSSSLLPSLQSHLLHSRTCWIHRPPYGYCRSSFRMEEAMKTRLSSSLME